MGATHDEANKYGSLSSSFVKSIAEMMEQIENIEDKDGFYLRGDIELCHYDGWRAGFIKSYEDWWIFVPDYKDIS